MRLCELIGRRLNDYDLSQTEAAKMIGISCTHLYRILSGKRYGLSTRVRAGLVRALDLSPDVIEKANRE